MKSPIFLLIFFVAILFKSPAEGQVLPITTTSEEARKHFLLGREAAFHWDAEQAHVHLKAATNADPALVLAYLHLAGTSSPSERQPYFDLAESYRYQVSQDEQRMIDAFRAFLLDEQYEYAIDLLGELAEAYPDDRYLPTYIGLRYLNNLERYDAADRQFQRVRQQHPDFVQLHNYFGYISYFQGEIEAAEESFLNYLNLAPEQTQPYLSLGQYYFRTGRFEESAGMFEQVMARNPDYNTLWTRPGWMRNILGQAYLEAGRYEEAEETFSENVNLYPGDPHVYNSLGLLYLRTSRYTEAAAQFELLLELDPGFTAALDNLVLARTKQVYGEESSVGELADQAMHLHQQSGREGSDQAVELLLRHIENVPKDYEALYALGEIYLERGVRFSLGPPEFSRAECVGRRLIPLNPARGYEIIGRSYMWRGEHSFALMAFENGLEKVPDDAQLWAHLSWRHFQTGEHHRGIPAAEASIRIDPMQGLGQEVFGFSLFHIDRPDSTAEEAFNLSIAVDEMTEGYGGFHLLTLSRGDMAEAIAYGEQLLSDRPDWPWSYAFLGHAHYFAGNDVEAIRYLEEARLLNPDIGVQYTGRAASLPLADLYLRQGRHEEAVPLIAHALSRADRRLYFGFEPWNSYYQYAGLALIQGDRDGALRWLQAALVGGMPGPVLIERDPVFSDLQGDPAFEEIITRLTNRRDEILQRLDR